MSEMEILHYIFETNSASPEPADIPDRRGKWIERADERVSKPLGNAKAVFQLIHVK